MQPLIVGIAGLATAGKTTAAFALKPHGFTLMGLADKVKECLFNLNPPLWLGEEMVWFQDYVQRYGWHQAKKDPIVRGLLQRLGTETGRDTIHPNLWIQMTKRRIKRAKLRLVAIHDVRFPNEAAWIQSTGCLLWIDNPKVERINNHKSESGILRKTADEIIVNDGTIEELHEKVYAAVLRCKPLRKA